MPERRIIERVTVEACYLNEETNIRRDIHQVAFERKPGFDIVVDVKYVQRPPGEAP